jgi:hypothetical protein
MIERDVSSALRGALHANDLPSSAAAIRGQRSPKMWEVLGFFLATAIGLATVLAAGRRGSTRHNDYPWLLEETAKLHVGIMGSLAGFAFTGIVLVVTFARDRPGVRDSALDTVIVMFFVSYLFWSATRS